MALQAGYTGDSPEEAADFLVANNILPPEAIGDLDRPADEAFFDGVQDAGVAPELLISSAIRAGVDEGSLVTWALGAGIDVEVTIAEAIEAGGDAATIFRAAIEGGVDADTALTTSFEAGAELGEIVPVAVDLGISIGDTTAAALEAGLAPDEIATYIAPFVPAVPDRGVPEGVPGEGVGLDLVLSELIRRMVQDGALGPEIAAVVNRMGREGLTRELFDLIGDYFAGRTDFRPIASPFL